MLFCTPKYISKAINLEKKNSRSFHSNQNIYLFHQFQVIASNNSSTPNRYIHTGSGNQKPDKLNTNRAHFQINTIPSSALDFEGRWKIKLSLAQPKARAILDRPNTIFHLPVPISRQPARPANRRPRREWKSLDWIAFPGIDAANLPDVCPGTKSGRAHLRTWVRNSWEREKGPRNHFLEFWWASVPFVNVSEIYLR